MQWGAFTERNDTNVSARLSEVLVLSDVVEVRAQTSRPITQHTQTIPSQTSFSLMSVDGLSLLDLVAPSRDEYTEWMEGLAFLFQSDRNHPDVTSVPDRLIKVRITAPGWWTFQLIRAFDSLSRNVPWTRACTVR